MFSTLATAQGPYSTTDMRFLYALNVIGNTDPTVRAELQQLKSAGINVIPIDGLVLSDYQNGLQALKADPLLSQFKVVLKINQPVFNAWSGYTTQVCGANPSLPTSLTQVLDGVATLAQQNPDLVVGYYTFDEPSNPRVNKGTVICYQYQELVYQRLRQDDPNASARPVIIANNLYNDDPSQIQASVSADAQDVVFVDQYSPYVSDQEKEYSKWKSIPLKAMVPVFPAYNATECADPRFRMLRPAVQTAIDTVYSTPPIVSPPPRYGTAYFAFWPSTRPNFKYDAENCGIIFNAVISDLQYLQPAIDVILSK